ncbi:MAG: sigma-70 family RNA polymerase sigma factor [Bacteroidales bacterium]|jgi:RNA polymerase sigma-70 factor (ECF subfamily)|nr:sigma-70 family RNA polymerase sigma factor [Bacteroidales bacterium]
MEDNTAFNMLIEQCKNGERKAQKAVFEKYKDYMLALCQRYASSDEEAEDMLMEGFLRAFQNIHLYRDLGKEGNQMFAGWLKKVIINSAINSFHHNKKSKEIEVKMPLTDGMIEMETDYAFSAEELIGCMRRLPPLMRSVFNMSAIDELNNEEIANILRISKDAVKVNMYRARNKMKQYLYDILNNK